jgi:ABC-type Zn uptake system ZnuABC Zn-binding protein ZnuA
VFAEAQFNDDLARTIADETGATVVSSLYTDSVGDPPADTYESTMRWNVDQVVAALGG